MEQLDESYWTNRYETEQTGWDIGQASPPLVEYAQRFSTDTRILIPGAGNAHEAAFLWEKGYHKTYVLDISKAPLERLAAKYPEASQGKLIHSDFFEYQDIEFDLILEQTFFCALNPKLRPKYIAQMHALIAEKGQLAGVLFNIPLYQDHPPFGGNEAAYRPLFEPYFHLLKFEPCRNSIKPRQGSELFICLEKKQKAGFNG